MQAGKDQVTAARNVEQYTNLPAIINFKKEIATIIQEHSLTRSRLVVCGQFCAGATAATPVARKSVSYDTPLTAYGLYPDTKPSRLDANLRSKTR